MQEKALDIYSDGGSRGNPGESACAFVAEKEGKVIYSQSEFLGTQTNNVAEYNSVILALKWLQKFAKKNDFSKIIFHLDSLLIASQINGKYKIKNENLRNLFFTVKSLETKIPTKIFYVHIYREKNKLADLLVNKCLDGVSRKSRF